MGVGHFARCLTLAELLRERGAAVRFVCRKHPGHLMSVLRELNIATVALPAPEGGVTPAQDEYAAWLGVTQARDAAETIQALGNPRPDWLIVDHYGLDASWERALRPHAKNLLVIDDLANRRHDCEALLDQGYATVGEQRYRDWVRPECRLLLGPRYALLRSEYRRRREHMRPRGERLSRIVVFAGGSDPENLTGAALEVLAAPEFGHLALDLVVGVNNRHAAAIASAALARPRTTVHGPRPHLADLMEEADLAIGAGGATTWERMCLGLPSIVVSMAENQLRSCEALAADGLIRYLGVGRRALCGRLRQELLGLMHEPQLLRQMSAQCARVVDGFGAARVCESILPSASGKLRLRAANEGDEWLYLDWANDPEVRRQSLNSATIDPRKHEQWFAAKLADHDSRLFVMLAGELPVGQIRFDRLGREAVIDYSLDEQFRGRGWGRELVLLGMRTMLEEGPVVFRADVKGSNAASGAVFRKLGFREVAMQESTGVSTYRLEPEKHAEEAL